MSKDTDMDIDKTRKAQSFVPCSGKRTRSLSSSSSSSSSAKSSNSYLGDSVLIEILSRLPTTKFAIQCKCVCKDWYSLISTNYFATRFLSHHISHNVVDDDDDYAVNDCNNNVLLNHRNPCAFIVSSRNLELGHDNLELGDYILLVCSNDPMMKSCYGFQLSCLPEKREDINVLAVFNDLLLCGVQSRPGILKHYVCNPFTMQWAPLPELMKKHRYCSRVGFVCEPHYQRGSPGEYKVDSQYRYRVVRVTKVFGGRFVVETYCSETRKWSESVLLPLDGLFDLVSNIAAYNGKLHWYNGKDIVAYDPFNAVDPCFIDGSKLNFIRPNSQGLSINKYCIGVCRGHLRILQLVSHHGIDTTTSTTLTVWELRDYETGEWSLVHEAHFNTMKMLKGSAAVPQAFHPSDGNIVYFNFSNFITLYNMGTKEMELIGMIPYNYNSCCANAFPIVLPWWPTPIPTLP